MIAFTLLSQMAVGAFLTLSLLRSLVVQQAGVVAAEKFGASGIVDPRPYIVGRLTETFEIYPDIGTVLPAMGYGEVQLKDMETTINNTECDAVIVATPIDLNRILKIDKPNTRVFYDLQEIGSPNFEEILADFGNKHKLF